MKIYHVYVIREGAGDYETEPIVYAHSDLDLSQLMVSMAKDINALAKRRGINMGEISGLTVGQVKAKDANEAIDQAATHKWLKNTFYANVNNEE